MTVAHAGKEAHGSIPFLPNAPPRLVARLKELELDSLLTLCERLEGRLLTAKRPMQGTDRASDEELDVLVENLTGDKAMNAHQRRQHQQQLQYVQELVQHHRDLDGPTASPSPPQEAPAREAQSAQVLDNLLAELNGLLEKSERIEKATHANLELGSHSEPQPPAETHESVQSAAQAVPERSPRPPSPQARGL